MIQYLLVIAATVSSWFGIAGAAESDWDYINNGPNTWPNKFPTCNGFRQSPVNIRNALDGGLTPIKFKNYQANLQEPVLTNNGHSAQLSGKNVQGEISGGFLTENYRFLQLHFHWGSNNEIGSEHLINSRAFPMEVHLVHVNTKYSLSEALTKPDGLAVIAVFFRIDNKENRNINPIIKTLSKIKYENQRGNVTGNIKLISFIPKETPYYTYCGSLTTPLCDEIVTWVVFSHPLPISIKQIQEFRKLHFGDKNSPFMVNNFRPPQPLNGRKIYKYQHKTRYW